MLGALLAICEPTEGSGRVLGIVLPPLVVAGWVGLVAMTVKGAPPGSRWTVIAVLVACVPLGALLVWQDWLGTGDYLLRVEISVVVAAAIGAIAFLWVRDAGAVRLVVAAALGDVVLPGLYFLLFVFSLAVNNGCIG